MKIALDYPCLDWITLTTWDGGQYHAWQDLITRWDERTRPAKRMQYKGHKAGSLFVGSAYQHKSDQEPDDDKRYLHGMLVCSGWDSNLIEISHATRVTRIDLQVTTRISGAFDADSIADNLRKSYKGKGRPPNITAITNSDGLNTLYIGSRTSERFIRFYVKDYDGGRALRFEVEYKGDLARKVSGLLQEGGTIGGILRSELTEQMIAQPMLRRFLTVLDEDATRPTVETVQSDTIKWLTTQVSASVSKMLNDHNERDNMIELLQTWVTWAKLGNS